MGANPMQKMKRNSMLTGLIIGLIIGLVMCAIVYLFLSKASTTESVAPGDAVTVCVLNKDVKAGTQVKAEDIITKAVNKSNAPKDITTQVINGVAKINLSSGTILTSDMLNSSSETLTADLREQEYNMISLPTQLTSGDFIDVRLQLPNGGDYIVVSKKQVYNCNSSTVWLKMKEDEILAISNAIIEYYVMPGSKLYATKYTDPGLQNASTPTYCPNAEVATLISENPNITSQIIDGEGRFSNALKALRNNYINRELNNFNEDRLENIEEKMKEEIQSLKQSREEYFGALNSAN